MRYTIDTKVCKENNLSLPEVLTVLLVKTGISIAELFTNLQKKEILVKEDLFDSYLVTQHYDDIVSKILLDSDKDSQPFDRIDNLTIKMMELFPKSKKEGTSQYFRGNKKDISLRLKKFFKLYGNKYTDDQLLEATKRYVESFNGNYSYMRVLKYFIWKDEKKANAEGHIYIEEISDLASYIENDDELKVNNQWMIELK